MSLKIFFNRVLAEREGFEPSIRETVYSLSREVHIEIELLRENINATDFDI